MFSSLMACDQWAGMCEENSRKIKRQIVDYMYPWSTFPKICCNLNLSGDFSNECLRSNDLLMIFTYTIYRQYDISKIVMMLTDRISHAEFDIWASNKGDP